jgi:P27 family predicted phage terminase small subunit
MSKTTSDHLRDGTFRPDRHKVYTPAGALLRELPPPPPDVLSPEAERIYTETGKYLIEQKFLKITDLQTLTIYAGEVATCHEMARELRREGLTIICNNGIETVNPKRKIQEAALRNSSILADRLGLNPASRGKIKGSSAFADEQPAKADPILSLMKKATKQ